MAMLRHFASRRNSVSLNDDGAVLAVRKAFAETNDFENEVRVYSLVEHSPVRTAAVLSQGAKELTLSYLPGRDFVEVLERQEAEGRADLAPWEALARWLYDFRRITGLVMTDMNLRNFILDDETGLVAGLDFEQCRRGDFEEMAAGLCAYTLLYDPEMSELKKSISAHLQEFFAENCACRTDSLRERTETRVREIREMRRAKRAGRTG